ncbi:GPI ethanolamine phosphate transferase 3 [Thecamonas trahens ATCC 50062]|uniref:GPI ethanolamine phosphate transferase 3 n=1 Tax=Thecamonas trahens ATCC 50062 TaxID=461836 RepID=A0A0L0DBL8_THETB|nr:GPI ethanolamine phosphate transferase 3 [Thecamonas trahens ATCC 50062]KNC48693.1 GPI ethanolamine phosphate transferase 3 [Thecamonas trahens ATCC 50062]|eukprot:XP_013762749.1 GPI ethanolamine phosphate transferase 3 [Thecamonas trahens ATCC 50062]
MAVRGYPHVALPLATVLLLAALSAYLFSSGFLLSRVTVPTTASIDQQRPPWVPAPAPAPAPSSADSSSNTDSRSSATAAPTVHEPKRIVMVVIDALRYDFAFPPPPSSDEFNPAFHGRLPVLEDIAGPGGAGLAVRLQADPPTTTMQRLKALMSGGLPAFIEIGSNFDAQALDEDSLPLQMLGGGKRVAFMGDDTWGGLFPGLLGAEPALFDSFNVKDLDTVDAGIEARLFPLLEQPADGDAYDAIIAHFLGVDHAGHTYGPNHPRMSDKLDQMNTDIARVVAALADDDLLVILGDHGMTSDGGHGGATLLETGSVLVAYSPARAYSCLSTALPAGTVVDAYQIDMVPALATLLGLPIPFSSMGVAFEPLLCALPLSRLETARFANAAQISGYLHAYGATPRGAAVAAKLSPLLAELDAALASSGEGRSHVLPPLLRSLSDAARDHFTTFDLVAMASGLVCGVLALCWLIAIAAVVRAPQASCSPTALTIHASIAAAAVFYVVYRMPQGMVGVPSVADMLGTAGSGTRISVGIAAGCMAGSLLAAWYMMSEVCGGVAELAAGMRLVNGPWYGAGAVFVVLVAVAQLSNSYVEALASVVRYLTLTGVLLSWRAGANAYVELGQPLLPAKAWTIPLSSLAGPPLWHVVHVLWLAVTVLASGYSVCAPERASCAGSSYEVPLLLQLSAPLLVGLGVHRIVRGRRNELERGEVVAKYLVPGIGGLISAHWTLHALSILPVSNESPVGIMANVALPRAVYGLAFAALALVVGTPKFALTQLVPARREGEDARLLVVGFSTALGSTLLCAWAVVALVASMVLGFRAGWWLLLVAAWMAAASKAAHMLSGLHAKAKGLYRRKGVQIMHDRARDSFDGVKKRPGLVRSAGRAADVPGRFFGSTAVLWSLGLLLFYFASGGRYAFASLRVDAAFVGFVRLDSQVVGGALVALATLAAPILFALGMPMAVVWFESHKLQRDYHRDALLRRIRYPLAAGAMAFLMVENRHLMAFRVFAPKFAFDAVLALSVLAISLCAWLLTKRIVRYLADAVAPHSHTDGSSGENIVEAAASL